jgi:hypothetical protein
MIWVDTYTSLVVVVVKVVLDVVSVMVKVVMVDDTTVDTDLIVLIRARVE